MIDADLVLLGVAFYDAQRQHGGTDFVARHAAVAYMRRKDVDSGDAMPYHEALANALAQRAADRMNAAPTLNQLAPRGNA